MKYFLFYCSPCKIHRPPTVFISLIVYNLSNSELIVNILNFAVDWPFVQWWSLWPTRKHILNDKQSKLVPKILLPLYGKWNHVFASLLTRRAMDFDETQKNPKRFVWNLKLIINTFRSNRPSANWMSIAEEFESGVHVDFKFWQMPVGHHRSLICFYDW